MSRKYFYYVGVQNNHGMSFVTKIDNKNRQCFWNVNEKPLSLSLSVATSLAEGLTFNFHTAVVVKSFYELENHFVSDEKEVFAVAALLDLVTDICKRNKIKKLVWSTNKSDRVNHKNGCNLTVHRDFANKSCPGDYLYERHDEIVAEVNKRLGVETTSAPEPFKPYLVKVTASALNIRRGAGTNFNVAGVIRNKGVYTIVEEKKGKGSTKGWGKLKSGAGWISLDFCEKR